MLHDKDPGWYPDPHRPKPIDGAGDPGDPADSQPPKFRWWDGEHWTDARSATLWAPAPHYPEPIDAPSVEGAPSSAFADSWLGADALGSVDPATPVRKGDKRELEDRDLVWRVRAWFWEYDPDGRRRPLIVAGAAVSAVLAIGLITATALAASRTDDRGQGNITAGDAYPVERSGSDAGEAGSPHGSDPGAPSTGPSSAGPSWAPTSRSRWTPSTTPRPRDPSDPSPTTGPTPPGPTFPASPGPTTGPGPGPGPGPEPRPTSQPPEPRPRPTGEPTRRPRPPRTPAPTRTPTPPATPTPTRTPSPAPTGPQAPVMPPEAKQKTPAGAEAGVRHQVALFDFGGKTGDYGPAEKHTWADCEFCNGWMSNPEALFHGKRVSVESAETDSSSAVDDRITVTARLQIGGGAGSALPAYRFEMDWEPNWTHWDVVSITPVMNADDPEPSGPPVQTADPEPTYEPAPGPGDPTVTPVPLADPVSEPYANALSEDCAMVYTTCSGT